MNLWVWGSEEIWREVWKKPDLEVTGVQVAFETWECLGSLGTLVSQRWVEVRGWHRQPRRGGQSRAGSAGQSGATEAGGGDFRTAVVQGRERRPGGMEQSCVRRAGCTGEGGWAGVCAGGAGGRVAGQWPMGERAKEKQERVQKRGRRLAAVGESPEGPLSSPRWGVGARTSGGLAGAEGVSCLCMLLMSVEEETNLSMGQEDRALVSETVTQSWTCPRACRAGGRLGAIRMVGRFVVYIVGTGYAHGGLQGSTCGSPPSPEAPERTGPSCSLTLHPSPAQCQGPLHQESLKEVDLALLLVNSLGVASNRGQVACPLFSNPHPTSSTRVRDKA